MLNGGLIVSFEKADFSKIDKLGAKGANLVEDFQHIRKGFVGMEGSIDIPDGFILSTDVWKLYREAGNRLSDELFERILKQLVELENHQGRLFGDTSGRMPLIVAVRGGAPVSLPGAISSVLNVGLNDEIVSAIIAGGEDESFALTTYLTAIRIYGEVVLEIDYDQFYQVLKRTRAGGEGMLSVPLLQELIEAFKEILAKSHHPHFQSGFELNPQRQLRNTIEAVLASWMSLTAVEARRSRQPKVADDMGTAVIIQKVVFGNRNNENCLSGVLFTRNQRTGANYPVIEWAPKVQCDKIVSGKLRKQLCHANDLQEQFPGIYELLLHIRDRFETKSKRPLDIEFTVENGKLFLLQRRPLRMTSNATVRSMWDFVDEGKTNIQLASLIINKALEQPEKILRDGFHDYAILARGEPITDSADSGILVFGTESALELANAGREVILLRKRPYGEADVAVNHPMVRGIVRYDGNTTGHEAVSAVAYSKPYLINLKDVHGLPLVVAQDDQPVLNPQSVVCSFLGKRVFVDCERGILFFTEIPDVLEDRRTRKKLYLDWEYLREQFDAAGYQECDYSTLLDLHYQWELELEQYQALDKKLRENNNCVSTKELLQTFSTYLRYVPERYRDRTLRLKDICVEDFDFGPPLFYRGNNLPLEVSRILRVLLLCTTWCTHWLHEIMVQKARERGETENDVIRDIFLKNRTMSLMRDFEAEGFHVMKVPKYYHLILASNFEYSDDLDKVQVGPGTLDYAEKEILASRFMCYLEDENPEVHRSLRVIRGEPPLGQGHARIISIGLSVPHSHFDLVCRYLRVFLDQSRQDSRKLENNIPHGSFTELYNMDPFFAPFPELAVSQEVTGTETTGDCLLAFGKCSFGEFDGFTYGQEGYDNLHEEVKQFESFLQQKGKSSIIRPWQFEVDPYRRHSVIAAVGIRFDRTNLNEVLTTLKDYLRHSI